jgi:hypothetical protein
METLWDKEVLVRRLNKYGPVVSIVASCVLTGSLVDPERQPTNEEVVAGLDFVCESIQQNVTKPVVNVTSIETIIIILSILIPLLPVCAFESWNVDKTNKILSHALGQSTNFASAETIRHFLVSPNQEFFEKCNLTSDRCNANVARAFQLVPPSETNTTSSNPILCPQASTLLLPELISTLHSNPNVMSCLIGSAILSFIANVIMWKNKRQINPYFKAATVLLFVAYIALITMHQSQTSSVDIVDSFLAIIYGAVIQFLIILFYQFRQPNTPSYKPVLPETIQLKESRIVK